MGSIAIISDIHGNITALEAVLKYVKERSITQIICLGDLVGKGPNSSKVVDMIREACEVVVYGNWDDFIQQETDNPIIKWHQKQLGTERLSYLGTLPFHFDFYMSGNYVRLYHASAKSVHHRVVPMIHPLEEKLAMFDQTEHIVPIDPTKKPDVIGYGDIHAALIEPIDPRRILFNAGSVGNPLDVPQATFVILHGNYDSLEPAPFSIEIVRVPYNIEGEIQLAKEKGLPDIETYALELREAIYRGSAKAKKILEEQKG